MGGKGGAKKRVASSAEGDERGAAAIPGCGGGGSRGGGCGGTWDWGSSVEEREWVVRVLRRPFPEDCNSLPHKPGAFCPTLLDVGGQVLSGLAFFLARLGLPAVGRVKLWGPEWSVGGETRG